MMIGSNWRLRKKGGRQDRMVPTYQILRDATLPVAGVTAHAAFLAGARGIARSDGVPGIAPFGRLDMAG
jgi:hypothetical protein